MHIMHMEGLGGAAARMRAQVQVQAQVQAARLRLPFLFLLATRLQPCLLPRMGQQLQLPSRQHASGCPRTTGQCAALPLPLLLLLLLLRVLQG